MLSLFTLLSAFDVFVLAAPSAVPAPQACVPVQQAVRNPGFETVVRAGSSDSFPPWTVASNGPTIGSPGAYPYRGKDALYLIAPAALPPAGTTSFLAVTQTLSCVDPNLSYNLSAYVGYVAPANKPKPGWQPNFVIDLDGVLQNYQGQCSGYPTPASTDCQGLGPVYRQVTFDVKPQSQRPVLTFNFTFYHPPGDASYAALLDEVTFSSTA